MANSATVIQSIPLVLGAFEGTDGLLRMIKVVIDTGSADLIVHSPAAGNHAGLMGFMASDTALDTITIKSGSTSLLPFNFHNGTDTSVFSPVDGRVLLATEQGEDLIFNSDGGTPNFTGVIWVAEFTEMVFKG